jgi:GT2 family glycosyltransferase
VPRISVIIPCYNARAELSHCLAAFKKADFEDAEYIVVDDASTDDLAGVVRESTVPVQVIRMETRSGAAAARNAGARKASGEILVFLDADVCVHRDTLSRIAKVFAETPEMKALMGSYDNHPSERGFHSQFRNLLHSYVHQNGRREACTFWTGCGAVYRHVFLQHGGFDETPGLIDDVEFGRRLAAGGVRIDLRPEIQVQHRKRWTLLSWIATDFWLRGVPWTLLIFRERSMPNVLNLDYRNRASVALAWAALLTAAAAIFHPDLGFVPIALAGVTVWLNRGFYSFLRERGGLRFAAASMAAHWLHLFVCSASFIAGAILFCFSSRREPTVLEDLAD